MHKFRIAFVNTHPIQYFAPLYAYLNRTGAFAVTALYFSDFSVRDSLDRAFGQTVKWDVDLLSGYDSRFVEGAGLRDEPKGFFLLSRRRSGVISAAAASTRWWCMDTRRLRR